MRTSRAADAGTRDSTRKREKGEGETAEYPGRATERERTGRKRREDDGEKGSSGTAAARRRERGDREKRYKGRERVARG